MIALNLIWWFAIVIILIVSVYALFHANFKRTYWLRDDLHINRIPQSKQIIVVVDDEYIYSDILQDNVLMYCHQSARLNDKYCVYGRALEYPSTQ